MAAGIIYLSTPLGAAHAIGAPVTHATLDFVPGSPAGEFVPGIFVCDKLGFLIGVISDYVISAAPSRSINAPGSMSFFVPRNSPDAVLLDDDRLVAIQSELGDEPWVGTMSVQESGTGQIEVQCEDVYQLWADGLPIEMDETVPDATTASTLYLSVLNKMNLDRAATNEIVWLTDYTGTKTFPGDLQSTGSAASLFEEIAARSGTEYSWKAVLGDPHTSSQFIFLVHVVRDAFAEAVGMDLTDDPDAGNIVSDPRVTRDPTPIINAIRLKGQTTDIAALLPDWARWAVHEIEPEVTVEIDPGTHRRRGNFDMTVEWSLSKTAQLALAQQTLDEIYFLYQSFLRAIHDIQGRPYHEGYVYAGPPDAMEAKVHGKDSFSRRAWRPRLQLLETNPDHPVSGVMLSDKNSQDNFREWLIVDYNRVSGVQHVKTYAIPLAAGLNLVQWHASAPVQIYHVSGQRVVSVTTTSGPTGAEVAPYNVRVYWPANHRYINLRQVINGPNALKWYVDPSDHHNTFTDLGPDAAIDTVDDSGASFIGKVYDFENYAIKDWDPRRDGIGELLARTTAWYGITTQRPRWHIVSYDVGDSASTSLVQGISSSETSFEVTSILGFPDQFPFDITVDDGPAAEDMTVTAGLGADWTVTRGITPGRPAIIHEEGTAVKRLGGETWDGFVFDYDWPEGLAFATEQVNRLSKPQITISVKITNQNNGWLTVKLGSTHHVSLTSEGIGAGWNGMVRILGYATDWDAGVMEVFTEWLG